ncbi:hypothetical protein AHF37_08114 [Paragonimus kellicotti]|nr:hypothetical protein AHF37_08114 [Paragonimus kellicotti]
MSNTADLGPSNVEGTIAQPMAADDRREFQPPLRHPLVLHSDGGYHSILAISERSIRGLPFLSSLTQRSGENVFGEGMYGFRSPAPVILEPSPVVSRKKLRTVSGRTSVTGGISRRFSEGRLGAGAKGPRTVAPCRM